MKLKKIIISLLILITLLIPVSFASWYVSGLNTNIPATEENVSPVAYIVKDGVRKDFNTLERALYTANNGDVIYVIPNIGTEAGKTNKPCVLNNDSTIKPGVTLFLPFDNNNEEIKRVSSNPTHSPLKEKEFLKNHLIINSGVALTNYGKIILAGVVNGGSGGNYVNGQTSGNYSQITLRRGANIINEKGSSVYCYGAFKEELTNNSLPSPVISVNDGSHFYAPFVVNEHRGGSIYMKWYLNDQSTPFNRWYFANVFTKINFKYGSILTGVADLFASGQHNIANINILGTNTNYLINMQEGTEVEFKCEYHTFNGPSKSFTEHLNYIDIYGSFELNNMSMNITSSISVSTNKYLFPLSYHHNVTLNAFKDGEEAHANLSQNIKLLPGASFKINKLVTCSSDQLAVYETFDDVAFGSKAYRNAEYVYPAQLVIEGFLTVNTFGGYAQTVGNGALFVIGNKNTIESKEITFKDMPVIGTVITYQTIALEAKGDTNDGQQKVKLNSNTPYEGIKNTWMISTRAKAYKINFDVNCPASTNELPSYLWKEGESTKSVIFYTFESQQFTLKTIGVSAAFREYYTMIDWAQDKEGNNLVSKKGILVTPGNITSLTPANEYNVYAIWKKTEFKIEYYLNFDESYSGSDKNKEIKDLNTYVINDVYDINQSIDLASVSVENADFTSYCRYKNNQGEAYCDIRENSIKFVNEFKNINPILRLYGFVSKSNDIARVEFINTNKNYLMDPVYPYVMVKKGKSISNSILEINRMGLSANNEDPNKKLYLDGFIYDNDVTFDEKVIVNDNITVNTFWKNKHEVKLDKGSCGYTVTYQGDSFGNGYGSIYILPTNNVISITTDKSSGIFLYTHYKLHFNSPQNIELTLTSKDTTTKDTPISGTIKVNGDVTISTIKANLS